MKILHINCNYISTELHQTMVEHLSNFNVENEVVIPSNDVEMPIIEMNDNVKIIRCFKKRDRYTFFRKQKKILNAIDSEVDVSNYTILHAYTLFTDGYTAKKLSEKYSIPYIVAIRNTDVNVFFKYMPWMRKTGLEVMLSAERIFFLSKSYCEIVISKYVPQKYKNVVSKKSCVIPNGVNDYWFSHSVSTPKRLNQNCLRLMYAGKINKNKNVEATVSAMAELTKEGINVHLDIAGQVEDKSVYNTLIENKQVSYLGTKKKEDLIKCYKDNDIFVMPSFTESFGLVYVEAMSQGMPVVYSKGQGFDGQFKEGEVGYSVDPRDPKDIARKIKLIMKQYSTISNNCIKCSKQYTWNSICAKYSDVYDEISGA